MPSSARTLDALILLLDVTMPGLVKIQTAKTFTARTTLRTSYKFKNELDIEVVPFKMISYVPETNEYFPADQVPEGAKTLNISGTELRRRLKTGAHIPDWFTYPQVQAILRSVHPPRNKQGFAVLFVGHYSPVLQTLANALESVLNQDGQRPVTLLVPNGKPHAATKEEVEQFSFVASQVAKNGGAVIASPLISTLEDQLRFKNEVQRLGGGVIHVHVATPLSACIKSDRSGFYKASKESFFEAPGEATLVVDFESQGVGQIVHEVILELEKEGYVGDR